ncbi:MAG TPA: kelch repeat-containing protein [Kofleriaceae bacterium]|nr:kelch repeat-containing protein [Kofleriaceae bacterium]
MTGWAPRAALIALLAGCSADRPVLRPIIDAPDPDDDAYPYAGLTSLVLTVARGGEGDSVTIPIGEPLELGGAGYGSDIVIHLSGLAGEIETAYGRTCAADLTPEILDQSPELHLYLSRIVMWAPEPGEVDSQRTGVLAYTLPDGRAAFVGGWPTPMAGRFDPQDGAFVELPTSLETRQGAVLAPLADGRALVIGGVNGDDDGVALVEVVDPRPPDQGLGPGGPLEAQPGPRLRDHAAATLVDGSVLVVGGEAQERSGRAFSPATRTAWLFAFGDGGVLQEPRQLGVEATLARAGHSMTRLGDEVGADVLVVGGRDETGLPVAQAELYRPLRQAFETVDGAVLLVPRWGHTAVRLPGGSILIIGGMTSTADDPTPVAVSTLELYDPVQGVFTDAGTMPPSAGLNGMSVSALPDGRVLLAGGVDAGGDPVATAFIARLDSLTGEVNVSPTDSLEVPRAGHGAAPLCDGTILVVGGTDDAGAPGSERYNPPSTGRR